MNGLPGRAGEIETIIGLELTVKLLKARGGTEVDVPIKAEGSLLAGIIGTRACEALIRELGHGRITLPCSHMRGRDAQRVAAKSKAQEMMEAGASNMQIALACDLHVHTVSRYRREFEASSDRAQGELDL